MILKNLLSVFIFLITLTSAFGQFELEKTFDKSTTFFDDLRNGTKYIQFESTGNCINFLNIDYSQYRNICPIDYPDFDYKSSHKFTDVLGKNGQEDDLLELAAVYERLDSNFITISQEDGTELFTFPDADVFFLSEIRGKPYGRFLSRAENGKEATSSVVDLRSFEEKIKVPGSFKLDLFEVEPDSFKWLSHPMEQDSFVIFNEDFSIHQAFRLSMFDSAFSVIHWGLSTRDFDNDPEAELIVSSFVKGIVGPVTKIFDDDGTVLDSLPGVFGSFFPFSIDSTKRRFRISGIQDPAAIYNSETLTKEIILSVFGFIEFQNAGVKILEFDGNLNFYDPNDYSLWKTVKTNLPSGSSFSWIQPLENYFDNDNNLELLLGYRIDNQNKVILLDETGLRLDSIPGNIAFSNVIFLPELNDYRISIRRDSITDIFKLDRTSQVFENDNIKQINVFPNPSNDKVTFDFGDLKVEGTLSVFNHIGQKISEIDIQDQSTLDISSYPKGNYFFFLRSSDDIFSGRFVKI